eukprot:Anaeramoba_flamelloidesa1055036_29.p3 GENE.a1055036_29~~a1055036_29.p3  ORF type:complete len:188 (+),score=14.14 a1055036_29:34-597(+)
MFMKGIAKWLMMPLLLLVGSVVQAYERDGFLQHQYRAQCLSFAENPEHFRLHLEAGALPQLPGGLVRQLLMGQDHVQGWALAYQGRREYVLVLADDEERCAIIARYADAEKTLNWFEQLVASPPAGYRAERLQPTAGDRRYAGDAQVRRWAWRGPDRVLEHSLMASARQDEQIQAILSLTLKTTIEQ